MQALCKGVLELRHSLWSPACVGIIIGVMRLGVGIGIEGYSLVRVRFSIRCKTVGMLVAVGVHSLAGGLVAVGE